jgi:hypothetical protein
MGVARGVPGNEELRLLLNHEIASVITAMRQNAKWAVVPRYYVSPAALADSTAPGLLSPNPLSGPRLLALLPQEEDRNEPSKYDDAFRSLRSDIFKYQGVLRCLAAATAATAASKVCGAPSAPCLLTDTCSPVTDWTKVDPMTYLEPFLNLIKASDVSGPITGAAAVALQRILASGLLGGWSPLRLPQSVRGTSSILSLSSWTQSKGHTLQHGARVGSLPRLCQLSETLEHRGVWSGARADSCTCVAVQDLARRAWSVR